MADELRAEPAGPASRNLTWLLLLMIAVPGFLALLVWLGLALNDQRNRQKIRALPRTTQLHVETNGDLVADVHADWRGGGRYAVIDIGDVRLVLPGKGKTGVGLFSSSGQLTIKSSAWTGKGFQSYMGGGPERITGKPIPATDIFSASFSCGQATISFDEKPYLTIRDAAISAGNTQVKIGEGLKTVFLRGDGTVESIEDSGK